MNVPAAVLPWATRLLQGLRDWILTHEEPRETHAALTLARQTLATQHATAMSELQTNFQTRMNQQTSAEGQNAVLGEYEDAQQRLTAVHTEESEGLAVQHRAVLAELGIQAATALVGVIHAGFRPSSASAAAAATAVAAATTTPSSLTAPAPMEDAQAQQSAVSTSALGETSVTSTSGNSVLETSLAAAEEAPAAASASSGAARAGGRKGRK